MFIFFIKAKNPKQKKISRRICRRSGENFGRATRLGIFGIFGDLVRGKLKQITSHCLPYKQTNKKDILKKKFNNQFLGG